MTEPLAYQLGGLVSSLLLPLFMLVWVIAKKRSWVSSIIMVISFILMPALITVLLGLAIIWFTGTKDGENTDKKHELGNGQEIMDKQDT